MKKRIMCFGDSLTWGWIPAPDGGPTTRYPFEQRWTGAMAAALGDGYEIIEEGLPGRTTNIDDPLDARLNGANYLPAALASHFPLDLVVLMLGTNDTKWQFHRTPYEIAVGVSQLVRQVLTSAGGVGTSYPAPKLLLVSPPALSTLPHAWFDATFEGAHEKSAELARQYAALAAYLRIPHLDAGAHLTTGGADGVHFSAENNLALGAAIADRVRELA